MINADSHAGVSRELRILTARPSAWRRKGSCRMRSMACVLQRNPAVPRGGAARRLRQCAMAQAAGRVPILCGGTGLYLQSALTQGIADIPPGSRRGGADRARVPCSLSWVRRRCIAGCCRPTRRRRPTLRPSDGQRLARAWEVWRGTGRGHGGVARGRAGVPQWPCSAWCCWTRHAMSCTVGSIASRFDAMMLGAGALAEIEASLATGARPGPACAAGARRAGIDWRSSAESLLWTKRERRAVLATTQYTKRQSTWFRNRTIVDPCLVHTIHARFADRAQFSESDWKCGLMRFVKSTG